MPIICGIISDTTATIGSDGRKFSAATVLNGQVTSPAAVERDDFNRTFQLKGALLVGATCGILEDRHPIREHLEQIVSASSHRHSDFTKLLDDIERELTQHLTTLNDVPFEERILEIILAGRGHMMSGAMHICALQFSPAENQINCRRQQYTALPVQCFCGGDTRAQDAAMEVFGKIIWRQHTDPSFARKVVERMVTAAIRAAAPYPRSNSAACGGKTFTSNL